MSRVLICAFACRPGTSEEFAGGEDILGWNIVLQAARFHTIWALTSTQNRAAIEDALRAHPIPNLYFVYVDLPRWLRPLFPVQGGVQTYAYLWQWSAYWTARKLHQQIHFDLFHHATYANDWQASIIGALLPIPYVRGPGGGAHRTPSAFLSEYTAPQRFWERVRVFGQWCFRHDPFFILGQRRAGALMVCNYEALRGIPAQWRDKAQLYPVTGVPESAFALPARAENGAFRVLSVGKLIRLKGFALAIRAFQPFARDHPDAQFEIIGEGADREYLENLVAQLSLDGRAQISKWLKHDAVLARMRACDVFLFASLRDGGGAVVVEALASGKPVVCLDIGGPGLHVTDACGIKIAPQTPEQAVRDLARALERLYGDADLRARLGTAARQRARELYHWDRLGERLDEIYRRCVG